MSDAPETPRPRPDRNLALDVLRVTEAAALAAARWIGRGDSKAADQAAVDAMRLMLDSVPMQGRIVIGEGEKDEAPMLYNGEEVGDGTGPEVDVAVDPVEGTKLTSMGQHGALALVAVASKGAMFDPGPCYYMHKIAAGPEARDVLDLEAPVKDNLESLAKAKGTEVEDLMVVVLDRPRNEQVISEIREAGARVKLIRDGDVAPAISAAREGTGIDMAIGIGGTPEGVITAAALKCLGGVIQGRLAPQKDDEKKAVKEGGYDTARVLSIDELVSGDEVFFVATGITHGDLVRGVRYRGTTAVTHSILMRSRSGTVRTIEAEHRREKLRRYASVLY